MLIINTLLQGHNYILIFQHLLYTERILIFTQHSSCQGSFITHKASTHQEFKVNFYLAIQLKLLDVTF